MCDTVLFGRWLAAFQGNQLPSLPWK